MAERIKNFFGKFAIDLFVMALNVIFKVPEGKFIDEKEKTHFYDSFEKRGFEDLRNPKKWLAVLRMYDRQETGLHLAEKDVVPYCKQLMDRMALCPDCVENGSCLNCGCPVPEKMLDPKEECVQLNWSKMILTENT